MARDHDLGVVAFMAALRADPWMSIDRAVDLRRLILGDVTYTEVGPSPPQTALQCSVERYPSGWADAKASWGAGGLC